MSTALTAANAATTSIVQQLDNANKLFDAIDKQGRGYLQQSDFMQIYAGMAVPTADSTSSFAGIQATFPISKSTFSILQHPTFSPVYEEASQRATSTFSMMDTDSSQTVTRDEFLTSIVGTTTAPTDATGTTGTTDTTTPTTPTTPTLADAQASADAMLSMYDTTGKGYVDEADIAKVWTADPTLGDPTQAGAVIAVWDSNGDGRVTRDELVTGFQVSNLATNMLTQLDPNGQGFIDVNALTEADATSVAYPLATLTSWDKDGDGKLYRQELITGIQSAAAQSATTSTATTTPSQTDPATIAAALMTQCDTNGDGSIDVNELATGAGLDVASGANATDIFNAWDTNADGAISLSELTTGVKQIQQASNIVSQYDTANKGWFDQTDIQAAIDKSGTTNASAADIMAWWDYNKDGMVTVTDVLAGLAAGGSVAVGTDTAVPSVDEVLASVGLSGATTTAASTTTTATTATDTTVSAST